MALIIRKINFKKGWSVSYDAKSGFDLRTNLFFKLRSVYPNLSLSSIAKSQKSLEAISIRIILF